MGLIIQELRLINSEKLNRLIRKYKFIVQLLYIVGYEICY